MSETISLDPLVQVIPSVISAGGTAIDLNPLLLTPNIRCPVGVMLDFINPAAVGAYFGLSSDEYLASTTIFQGFDNSDVKPGSLLFGQYNTSAVGAYLRGGSMAGVTLTQLKAMTGMLSVLVDGVAATDASAIVLTAATSFSNAATIIGTAIGAAVSFDSVAQAFVISSGTAGTTTSSIAYAVGSLATLLNLTATTGAIISPAANAMTPATIMPYMLSLNKDWASFTTLVEPVLADKISFAIWNNGNKNRTLYVPWDTDANAVVQGNTTCFGYQVVLSGYANVAPIYKDRDKALFIMGIAASIDFDELNGRVNFAYRTLSGLTPTVTDDTTSNTLKANGYNFYGIYSTAKQAMNFLSPGFCTGPYAWLDSFFNQVWMNAGLTLAMIQLLIARKSIPYNLEGYTSVESACLDPINAAVNFGAIRSGVTLSQAQIDQVNNDAGVQIDSILSTRGWYLQVLNAAPTSRAARTSPPCKLWYMDGGSIQQLLLDSVEVQ